jgi:hypothetical protein
MAHGRESGNFGSGVAHLFGADRVGDVFLRQDDVAALETALQVLGQLGQRVLVGQIGAAAQRRQRRQRARVQVMEAELSATRWATVPLPDAVGPSMVMTGIWEVGISVTLLFRQTP